MKTAKTSKAKSRKQKTRQSSTAPQHRGLRVAGRYPNPNGSAKRSPKRSAKSASNRAVSMAGRAQAKRKAAPPAPKTPPKSWGALAVSDEVFAAISKSSGTRLTQKPGKGWSALTHPLLAVRNQAGELVVCRVLKASKAGITVSQGWKLDPAYRLKPSDTRPGYIAPVARPNVPPRAVYVASRAM